MITSPMFCNFLFWIWFSQCVGGSNGLLDFLFERGPCGGAGSKEAELECQVNQVYERSGIKHLSGSEKSNAIEQGKQGLGCVASIAGIDLDSKLAHLGNFGFIKDVVFEQYYLGLSDKSNLEKFCQIAERRSSIHRQLKQGQGQEKEQAHRNRMDALFEQHLSSKLSAHGPKVRRRLGTPTAVGYPASTSASYSAWLDEYVVDYLQDGNTALLSNVTSVTENLLMPITTFQGEIVNSGLSIAYAVTRLICFIVGVVEFGFDPGDACGIISSSINLAIVVNEIALLELKIEYDKVRTHDDLISEAELVATNTDTAALVTSLTR